MIQIVQWFHDLEINKNEAMLVLKKSKYVCPNDNLQINNIISLWLSLHQTSGLEGSSSDVSPFQALAFAPAKNNQHSDTKKVNTDKYCCMSNSNVRKVRFHIVKK
jgi:hypothetical protein